MEKIISTKYDEKMILFELKQYQNIKIAINSIFKHEIHIEEEEEE